MKRPRRLVWPTFTILPSWTAMTGEPGLAKMSMPRRLASLSTGIAALRPLATLRFVSASERSSAYVARACTGKWPCVRPVSEPTRSAGRPPMRRARSRTQSTYQSAWL